MQSFKDVKGDAWIFPAFTFGLVLDIRDKTGVDFLGDDSPEAKGAGKWFGMLFNPRYLGRVLYVIFEDVIHERGLDERSFAKRFDADACESARMCIIESLVLFIHGRQQGAAMNRELSAVVAKLNSALLTRWKSTVGAALASLDSTPDPSA